MGLTLGGLFWVLGGRDRLAPAHAEGSVLSGLIAGVLGAFGQALGYVISKLALEEGIDPLSATVVRVAAAVLGAWVLAAWSGETAHSLAPLRDRRAVSFMVGGAFFGPFLGVTLSLVALQHVEAGVAASITAIYPILTLALSSRFHGERITARILGGAFLAIGGVVVLFLR